ncbi:MAG: hypothetical protein WDN49_02495 [Acetobacteraceae bacterium]
MANRVEESAAWRAGSVLWFKAPPSMGKPLQDASRRMESGRLGFSPPVVRVGKRSGDLKRRRTLRRTTFTALSQKRAGAEGYTPTILSRSRGHAPTMHRPPGQPAAVSLRRKGDCCANVRRCWIALRDSGDPEAHSHLGIRLDH